MKTNTILVAITAMMLFIGCASQHKGAAYGHENLFRQQIAETVLVKDWGYKIKDVRFSDDYRKALVTFTLPDKPNVTKDLILEDDGFRRYQGKVIDLDRMTANGSQKPDFFNAFVTVTLPDR